MFISIYIIDFFSGQVLNMEPQTDGQMDEMWINGWTDRTFGQWNKEQIVEKPIYPDLKNT